MDDQVREAIAALLQSREPPKTICPSEVARALAPEGWRPLMPQVRAAAIAMAKEGVLDIRQGGVTVDVDEPLRGPIRLARSSPASINRKLAENTPYREWFLRLPR